MKTQILLLIALTYSFFSSLALAQDLGNEKILISVIDTGMDLNNKELLPYLWKNPGETGLDKNNNSKETNGIDDDGNGFVDDVHGWNFVDNTNDLQDHHGHGTHIMSVILNFLKDQKLANKVEFQIVKYYHADSDTHNILKSSNQSFLYARGFNPQFVNYSGGGYTPSREEKKILESFDPLQTLIIAASGNQKNDNDDQPYFPASYKLVNLLSVGSINPHATPSTFSNFGKDSVNLFTQGELVSAFTLNQKIQKLSGTSQATAKLTAYAVYLYQEADMKSPQQLQDFFCEQTHGSSKLRDLSSCGKGILDQDIPKFKGKNKSLFEN